MKKIFLYMLICSFFLETQQSAYASGDNGNKKDYYAIDISSIDTTSELPLSMDFTHENENFSNFLSNTTEATKTISKKALPILPYVVIPSLYVLYKYNTSITCDPNASDECDKNMEFTISNIGTSGFNLLGGSFLMTSLFSDKIQKGLAIVRQKFLPLSMQSDNYKKILKYKQKIDENFKNKKITKKTKEKFYEEFAHYNMFSRWGDENAKEAKIYIERMKNISKLPSNVKVLDYSAIEPLLDELLVTYPEEIQHKIKILVEEICVASHSIKPEKTIVCFYGPPGTGKTHLTQKLAEILNLSMTCFKPSSSKAETMIAQNIDLENQEIMLDLFMHKNNNYKNNILFIDEFDCCLKKSNKHKDAFRDFFTLVCEKEQKFYESGKIQGLDIDISSTIIIMACNKLPADTAILDRIEVIEFKEVPTDKQHPIAFKAFEKKLKNFRIKQKITNENTEVINEIITKNTHPGVRVLKAIVGKYASHIARSHILKKDMGAFNVDVAYQAYEHEKNNEKKENIKKNEPEIQKTDNKKNIQPNDDIIDMC